MFDRVYSISKRYLYSGINMAVNSMRVILGRYVSFSFLCCFLLRHNKTRNVVSCYLHVVGKPVVKNRIINFLCASSTIHE